MHSENKLTTLLAFWAAIGPLVGIVVGHLLSRSWQRKQWYLDNRSQEYRELLSSLTNTYLQMMRFRSGTGGDKDLFIQLERLKMDSFRVLRDRILISSELESADILTQWTEAFHNFENDQNERKFSDRFSSINEQLVRMAREDPPRRLQH